MGDWAAPAQSERLRVCESVKNGGAREPATPRAGSARDAARDSSELQLDVLDVAWSPPLLCSDRKRP